MVTHNRIDAADQTTVTQMVAEVAGGFRDLVAAHAAQLQAEVRHEAEQARNAGVRLAIGSALSGVGAVFLLIAVVMVLIHPVGWPPWAAWLVVGAVITAAGVALAVIGVKGFSDIHLVPEKTLHSVRESLSCMTNAKN